MSRRKVRPRKSKKAKNTLSKQHQNIANKIVQIFSDWIVNHGNSENFREEFYANLQHILTDSSFKSRYRTRNELAVAFVTSVMNRRNSYKKIDEHYSELEKIHGQLISEISKEMLDSDPITEETGRAAIDDVVNNSFHDTSSDDDSLNKKFGALIRMGVESPRPKEARYLLSKSMEKAVEINETYWARVCHCAISIIDGIPDYINELRAIEEVVMKMTIPPIDSVASYESVAVSVGRIHSHLDVNSFQYIDIETACWISKYPKVRKTLSSILGIVNFEGVVKYSRTWEKSGFARIEIGHKLAAALAMTDVPDEVEAPWDTWSLLVPDRSLDVEFLLSNSTGRQSIQVGDDKYTVAMAANIERIWCVGCDPECILFKSKFTYKKNDELTNERIDFPGVAQEDFRDGVIVSMSMKDFFLPDNLNKIIRNLVKSVCLCITERSEYRRGKWKSPGRKKSITSKKKDFVDDMGDRYVVGKPITIDLRKELSEYINNTSNSRNHPKFQFLVRGHWRNQAYGMGRQLRRRKWIEPFWKGNEEARRVLRTYKLEEPSK